MAARALTIMKQEILNQITLSPAMQKKLSKAQDLDGVYEVMKKDFWVVTPCHSVRTGAIMEGTRLTLQVSEVAVVSLLSL